MIQPDHGIAGVTLVHLGYGAADKATTVPGSESAISTSTEISRRRAVDRQVLGIGIAKSSCNSMCRAGRRRLQLGDRPPDPFYARSSVHGWAALATNRSFAFIKLLNVLVTTVSGSTHRD